jgi:hypothetical protein
LSRPSNSSPPSEKPSATPPPALQAAFTHNPQARRGWELMPQQTRRQHLIDIFRSPYPDTRARNLEYTVRESARYAGVYRNAIQTDVET